MEILVLRAITLKATINVYTGMEIEGEILPFFSLLREMHGGIMMREIFDKVQANFTACEINIER